MEKGLGMEGMPRPFYSACYRGFYAKSLTAADSRPRPMPGVRLYALSSAGGLAQPATEYQGGAFYHFFFLIASTSFWTVPITAMAMTPKIES
jgi:hypothetical protein